MRLVFLGTGGGRFVQMSQVRSTAGFLLQMDGFNIHVDPGPGSLLRYKEMGIKPSVLDIILVSHNHTEHCTEAGVLTEAMTYGTRSKRGTVISGSSYERDALKYHKELPKQFLVMKAGDKKSFSKDAQKIEVEAVKTEHGDPETIGFIIKGGEGSLYYTSDTALLQEHLKIRADVVVANLTAIKGDGRMGIEEAGKLMAAIKPKIGVITHFGIRMLNYGPEIAAKEVSERSGTQIVAARDSMELKIDLRQKKLDFG